MSLIDSMAPHTLMRHLHAIPRDAIETKGATRYLHLMRTCIACTVSHTDLRKWPPLKGDPYTVNSRANRKANYLSVYKLFFRHCLDSVRGLFTQYLNEMDDFGVGGTNS